MFCIPIIARNTEEAVEKMSRSASLADIFEIRLDMMDTFDLNAIIRASERAVLVTYRSKEEGGKSDADPETRANHIITAIQEGADLVDVELSMPQKLKDKIFAARGNSKIVVSTHINDSTPSNADLEKIFNDSVATGADIIKIITRAETWEDNLRVLELIPMALDQGIKIIAFCMGPIGKISRILSHLMGAHLTFTSLEKGQESASGQIPINEMKDILGHFTT